MLTSMRLRAVSALAALVLLACGPASNRGDTTPRAGTSEALAGLPPRTDPPLALDDDDDLERARQAYEALPQNAADRAQRRAELWAAYQRHIDLALAQGEAEQALEHFSRALGMWSPADLADETKPAPGLAEVAPTAMKLYDIASRAGLDVESVTAVAVLRAADPAAADRWQAAYDDIASYADDLEIARFGPGAVRARPIKILEDVTARFASPWACRLLADLYVERQKARVAGIGQADQRMEGAHGPSIRTPVWNVIRAYARMDKLDRAADIVDTFAGQMGDQEEVRAALRAAFKPGGDPNIFAALAAGYARDEYGEAGDLTTARRICEAGARQYPRSSAPYRCLGLVAAQMNSLRLAVDNLEKAYKLEPDPGVGSILVTLYHFQIADLLQGERLDAARQALPKVEVFHAELTKKFPDKPADRGLDDLYLTFGRGMYALGETAEARTWLEKSQATRPNHEALELLGTIAHKRGEYTTAARLYEEAAKLPRETQVDQRIDEARLLRMAADARWEAGDQRGAESWYRAALQKWDQVLGTGLTDRQRVDALMERGRILWALGAKDDALRAFEAAVDTAGDTGVSSAFSDVVAFLYVRGAYEPALDAYHRGLARAALSENMKIYASLWVVYAARLRGEKPDPLAVEYLGGRQGTRWYHLLSRYAVGQLSWDELYAQATTRGRRAEAFFYHGLEAYAAGDDAGGAKLMRFVIDTDMLGFFEYDMAAYVLKHGVPRK
jgi:tetratricopeptide (TPR) repeat protein